MSPRSRLIFGPLAAITLAFGITLLPRLVPGYDPITQTVSEIGEIGSPAQIPFTIMLICVAGFILVFATALRNMAAWLNQSAIASYLTGVMAISAAGVGMFPYPHPLHNAFGLSELIGYQAPLALALTWRRDVRAEAVVRFSWIMGVIVWCALIANLATLDRGGALWHREAAVYGVVQRTLFAAWFVWVAGAGLMLRRFKSPPVSSSTSRA